MLLTINMITSNRVLKKRTSSTLAHVIEIKAHKTVSIILKNKLI